MSGYEGKTRIIQYNINLIEKFCEFMHRAVGSSIYKLLLIELLSAYGTIQVKLDTERKVRGFIFHCTECSRFFHINDCLNTRKILMHLKLNKICEDTYDLYYNFQSFPRKIGINFGFKIVYGRLIRYMYNETKIIESYRLSQETEYDLILQLFVKYQMFDPCEKCGSYMRIIRPGECVLKEIYHTLNHIIETRKQKSLSCRGND